MSQSIKKIFEAHQDWLRNQPGMELWPDGCRILIEIINTILVKNAEELFDKPVDDEHPFQYEYFDRLVNCLFYHWEKKLKIDSHVFAQQVVDEIRSQFKENNVFDHLTLTTATVRNEQKAYLVFYELYCGLFQKIAAKRDMYRVNMEHSTFNYEEANQDDCRESILDIIVGPPEKEALTRIRNARLEKYRGHGSLKRWLYTAVSRLVTDYLIKINTTTVPEDMPDFEPSERVVHLREVVKTLPKEDQHLIELYYYEGQTLEEIGRNLPTPRDKSTVQRRLQVVLTQIREQMKSSDVI